uniref:Uncharacterized protein n=1 Tax=viral metagenome TaxID=1070528 RepID=A0A6C0LPQ6_9ZZZZ
MASEANKSFLELFLFYLPGEVRRSVEEVVDAVTPATIARNDVLLSRRRNEIGQLRNYFVELLTGAVDSAIEEAVDEAVEKASVASSAASSRSASAASATTAAPSRSSTGSSATYSPIGFISGGTRRHRKKKLSTRRAHRVR